MGITIAPANGTKDEIGKLFRFYRRYSGTLGFMPEGAFMEYALDGTLIIACSDGKIVGYVMWRCAHQRATLAHLCVDEAHRQRGLAHALLRRMLQDTSDLAEVRLACRREYPANKVWPRHGFRQIAERPGRGKDGAVLLVWRRLNADDAPLLTLAVERDQGDKSVVVVDANVFIDFFSSSRTSEEGKSLLADWLEPEIQLCVTAELSNEISRNPTAAAREMRRKQMRGFRILEATGNAFDKELPKVEDLLPPSMSESDRSDRRQLAQAIACDADFFVTRDDVLLRHAPVLEAHLGVRILRPTDLVSHIYSAKDPTAYAPARLVGTSITRTSLKCEAECRPFQRFAEGELKAEFLTLCREVMSHPQQYNTEMVSPPGSDPVVLLAFERCDSSNETRIVLARTLPHRLAPTIVRRLLSDIVVSSAVQAGVSNIWFEDCADPIVLAAAIDLGFRSHDGKMVKTAVSGLRDAVSLGSAVGGIPPQPWSDLEYRSIEEKLWPVKISKTSVRSFLVPIMPHWAAQICDEGLAVRELFVEARLALALENVYYSASRINIPAGSRILWYVSKNKDGVVRQVRACSRSLGTEKGTAREMFRRFRRLGVYQWNDILRRADGDPEAHLTAYRFAFTEPARRPMDWDRLQEILENTQGRNPIASPVDVTMAFDEIYNEAFVGEA